MVATVALMALLSFGIASTCAASFTEEPSNVEMAVGTGVLLAAQVYGKYGSKTVQPDGMRMAGIAQEIWIDAIVSKLFADNAILRNVSNDDDRVLGGAVVHVPQAGAGAGGQRNRTVFPAGVVQRTDTDLTYALTIYTTNPVLITDAEKMEISYDKMQDVMQDGIEWLDGAITEDLLYAWAATSATQIVRTSGADSAENRPNATATGTRKIMTVADFKKAVVAMNKQNISKADRFALLSSDMYNELLDDPMLKERDVAKEADYVNGVVARLYGMTIMERSTVQTFSNAGTPVKKAVGAAEAAADNGSSLFYQKGAIALAMGQKKFYENTGDPTMFGDVYSALLKGGGHQRRADGKGVISLVQTAGA